MKKLTLVLAAVLITAMSTMAQVAINTDDADADASAILDVKSTTMGFLPPRMTQEEMGDIISPATGLMVYCTDCAPGSVRVFDGFNWVESNGYPAGLGENEIYNYKTGKIWMDRNLGASQVATSPTDAAAYGDLYQWGRLADGHQSRTSGTTTTLSTTDVPGHANFIKNTSNPYDWRNPRNNNLWQGVSGINNPCPSGYRLPTETEFDNERTSWASNNYIGAYASPLKLTVAGIRVMNGSILFVGGSGTYCSSSVDGLQVSVLTFNSDQAYMYSANRVIGYPVRCIKD